MLRRTETMIRLQKYLAEAGVASRRASERIIVEGRVAVNGTLVTELGAKVDPDRDRVTVEGVLVKSRRKLYVALNKPRGLVCSKNDEHGRPTIYQLLPNEWSHLNSVGRLDFNTEGLIFLTNDGDFSLRLTHPRYAVTKIYSVTVEGRVDESVPEKFVKGIWDAGEKLRASKVRILSASNAQSVLEVQLTEGKNREVRRLCESQRLTVKRLRRVQIGKIKLGELREGKWRTLTEPEIKSLLC
jgi:23S rRNA pseudouridine2605 synthase